MTQAKSEFAQDPDRLCRTKGHDFSADKPHPKSSFYDKRRAEKYCRRCRKWV